MQSLLGSTMEIILMNDSLQIAYFPIPNTITSSHSFACNGYELYFSHTTRFIFNRKVGINERCKQSRWKIPYVPSNHPCFYHRRWPHTSLVSPLFLHRWKLTASHLSSPICSPNGFPRNKKGVWTTITILDRIRKPYREHHSLCQPHRQWVSTRPPNITR